MSTTSAIGLLNAIKREITQLKKKDGDISELRKRDKKIRWDQIETAFHNRIRTNYIVN